MRKEFIFYYLMLRLAFACGCLGFYFVVYLSVRVVSVPVMFGLILYKLMYEKKDCDVLGLP